MLDTICRAFIKDVCLFFDAGQSKFLNALLARVTGEKNRQDKYFSLQEAIPTRPGAGVFPWGA